MASRRRDAFPGIHHVWVHATGNEPYFVDEIDRMTWVRDLVANAAMYELTCLALCQMTTHTHFLVSHGGSLSAAMQRLNSGYSRRFNIRHGRAGQFLRQRFGNRRIEDGSDLLGTFAYVVLNPVNAGLCPRAEDWRWSSFARTLGLSDDYPFVDASVVTGEAGSVQQLRSFVDRRRREYLAKQATSDPLRTRRGPWGQIRP